MCRQIQTQVFCTSLFLKKCCHSYCQLITLSFSLSSSGVDKSDHESCQIENKTRLNQTDDSLFPDYDDYYDDSIQKHRRKLFALATSQTTSTLNTTDNPPLAEDTSPDTEIKDNGPPPVLDSEVKWSQTFQVSHLDLQAQQKDGTNQQCNLAGNRLIPSSDTLPLVKAFMELFNEKHDGYVCILPIRLHFPGGIELSHNNELQ